jgi:hypothetical protein
VPTLSFPDLHPGQAQVKSEAKRFNVLAAGRRWGKNVLALDLLIMPPNGALRDGDSGGWPVAFFSATNKLLADAWREFCAILAPITTRKLEQEHRLEIIGGGSLDCWSLESEGAGRGRHYRRIVIDEAAHFNRLEQAWTTNLRPTLTDYQGDAWFFSTPSGRNYFWRLFQMGQSADHPEWMSWQYPSSANPLLPPGEVESARADMSDRSYGQEYLALFLTDSGAVFRNVAASIDRGRTETSIITDPALALGLGVDIGRHNDATVLSIIDETGKQHYLESFTDASYPRQVVAIKNAMTILERIANQNRAPGLRAITLQQPSLVLDTTGAGDVVYDMLMNAGIYVFPYAITYTSRRRLLDNLAAAFDAQKLRLLDNETQEQELIAFEVSKTPTGLERMDHPPGMHDDHIFALALGWHGVSGAGYHVDSIGAY